MAGRKKLGQILLEKGVIDEYQLKSALSLQKQWGGQLGKVMVDNRFIEPQVVLEALHEQTGIEIVHLTGLSIPAYLLKLVPVDLAEKLRAIPIGLEGEAGRPSERLIVAMSKPTNLNFLDELRFRSGKRIKPKLASDQEIDQAIQLHYHGLEVEPQPRSQAYSEQIQFGGREIEIDQSDHNNLTVVQGRLQPEEKSRPPMPTVASDPFADLDVTTSEPDPLDLSQPRGSSPEREIDSKGRPETHEFGTELDHAVEDVDLDDLEPTPAPCAQDFDLDEPEPTELEIPDRLKQDPTPMGLDENDALEDLEILEEIEPLERPPQSPADRSAELLADRAIPPPDVASVDTSDFDLDSVLAPLAETGPGSKPAQLSEAQDIRTPARESSSSQETQSESEASVIVDPAVSVASEVLSAAQDDWDESTMELDRSAPQIMKVRQNHLPDLADLDAEVSLDDRLDSLEDEEEIETREFDLKPSTLVESDPSADLGAEEFSDPMPDSTAEKVGQAYSQEEEGDIDDWVVFEEVEDSDEIQEIEESDEIDVHAHPAAHSVDPETSPSDHKDMESRIHTLLKKDPTLHVLIELLIRKGLISRNELLQAMQQELQKK